MAGQTTLNWSVGHYFKHDVVLCPPRMPRGLGPADTIRGLHLEQAPSTFQVWARPQDFELFQKDGLEDVVLGRAWQLTGALILFVTVAGFRNGSEEDHLLTIPVTDKIIPYDVQR